MTSFPKKKKFNIVDSFDKPQGLQVLALDAMTAALHQSIQFELHGR